MSFGFTFGFEHRTNRRVIPPIDPAILFQGSDLGVWLDPSDMSTMFQDTAGTIPAAINSPVALMRDKSGQQRHAVQATAGAQPILRQDENGKNYLEFDGVDDRMLSSGGTTPYNIIQPWTRVSAIQQITPVEEHRVFCSTTSGRIGALIQGPSPDLYIRSSTTVIGPSLSTLAIGVNGVVSEHHNGASSFIALNHDAPIVGDAGTDTAGNFIIAAASSAGANPTSIRFYGAIIRCGDISEHLSGLQSYMMSKAGVNL